LDSLKKTVGKKSHGRKHHRSQHLRGFKKFLISGIKKPEKVEVITGQREGNLGGGDFRNLVVYIAKKLREPKNITTEDVSSWAPHVKGVILLKYILLYSGKGEGLLIIGAMGTECISSQEKKKERKMRSAAVRRVSGSERKTSQGYDSSNSYHWEKKRKNAKD